MRRPFLAQSRRRSTSSIGSASDPLGHVRRTRSPRELKIVVTSFSLALARLHDRAGLPIIVRLLDRNYLDEVESPDADGRMRPLPEAQKEEIMINALRALATLGGEVEIDAIHALRDADPSLSVRQAAFETLERLEPAGRY